MIPGGYRLIEYPSRSDVLNSYAAPAWTEAELRRYMKYWNRQAWLGGVRFDEFRPPEPMPLFNGGT